MPYDVAVIGLGRVGLPLAITFADHGLSVLGVDKDAERLAAVARRADAVQGARTPTSRSRARSRPDCALRARRRRRAGRRDRAHARHADVLAHRDRHVRHPHGARRAAAAPARGPPARAALAPSPRTRPSSSPATSRSTAASRVGEDIFVAHVPERIAADRFMAEIGTLPCIVGGVGEASGERAAQLFEPLGAPIVQTTPVQAELAKIWANILRYATFALPNLLMMDCERYGANVFEVIDLINRDYPRGGIAQPGLHRRHLPAQGLRVQRGALQRARHAARGLARQRERAAVPRRGHQAPARRPARAQGRRARARVQGRHRRRARLALAQADPAARARAGRRRRPRPGRRRRRPRRSRRR